MCDHQWSVLIDSDSGQASDSSVNSGNKDVFVVILVIEIPRTVLHAWQCDAMTRNAMKRLATQNCVNCLYDMIGQSDMLSSYGTGNITYLERRGLLGTKKRKRRSIRAGVPIVL